MSQETKPIARQPVILLANCQKGGLEGEASKKRFFVASFCRLRRQKEATKRMFSGACGPAAPAGE
jgi:hypothetical protein